MTNPHPAPVTAADEEMAQQLYRDHIAHHALYETDAQTIPVAIARALADVRQATREADCKLLCHHCNKGVELNGFYHWVNDGLQEKGKDGRYVKCYAAAIRAQAGKETK